MPRALALSLLLACSLPAAPSPQYRALQQRLAQGWNTWDVHSVAAQVLLPEGFTIRIGLKHIGSLSSDAFLADPLIGRQGRSDESVFPGPRTWNGSYTSARISWRGHEFQLESAHAGPDLVILATPLSAPGPIPPALTVSAAVLWNRPGAVSKSPGRIEFRSPTRTVPVFFTASDLPSLDIPLPGPFFAASFTAPIGVSTGKPRTLDEIRAILAREKPQTHDLRQAMETVIGWDTIYEPSRSRVISPVSRLWSVSWGGYVLFDWDTFFAASLSAVFNRDLAYANAVEMLSEATPAGFVPNFARTQGWKSFDRSEPPVGAITVLALYRQFHDKWFLSDAFPALLAWNRWWARERTLDGFLVLGSDPDNSPGNPDDSSVGQLQAAKFESGLDNSPMYDDAPFDLVTHRMKLADVGMTSMYAADCDALSEIARLLAKPSEAAELSSRADRYRKRLQDLWDDKTGMFLNRDLASSRPSPRLSPTNFYPLLARAATPAQARRMIHDHLLNPAEFWGDWVIPSISRSDAAFKDQQYWRGRIWGPMNYLVYLGLCNYNFPDVRRQFAEKSLALFNREWRDKGHVHENYNAITGSGDDVGSSDRFYHWGALLGLIDYLENPPAAPR